MCTGVLQIMSTGLGCNLRQWWRVKKRQGEVCLTLHYSNPVGLQAAVCLLGSQPKHVLANQLQLLISSISLCSITVNTGVLAVFAGWFSLPLDFVLSRRHWLLTAPAAFPLSKGVQNRQATHQGR